MSKFDPIRDCPHGRQKGKCDSCDLEQAEKTIEQQQQRIAELEIAIKQSLGNIEYAAFNLCENTDLTIRSKGKIVESTCPETSLLIAIRDLKEVSQPPKE